MFLKKSYLFIIHKQKQINKPNSFIKNSVKTLLNCDRAAIFLVDQLQQTLKFVPDGGSQEIAIPMSHGIAGYEFFLLCKFIFPHFFFVCFFFFEY